jgi:transposase
MSASSVFRLLNPQDLQPHKVRYYLERRDLDFDAKRAEVLCVYQQVEFILENEELKPLCDVICRTTRSQVSRRSATPPKICLLFQKKHTTIGRDSEYKRHGTLNLLAGIDLVSGEVIGSVEERHRSREFVEFLKKLDTHYSPELRIQIILDNHSAHISKETKAYLVSVPDRFELIFTPKHGSWLNLIESFFAKMTKQVLRHLRVNSKDELKQRIEQYFQEINENPVPFRWKYGLES